MPIEIRRIGSEEEWRQHALVSAYSFGGDRSDEAVERRSRFTQRDWCLGAFDGGELVAGLVIIPFEQHIQGARIRLGGIASVSCLPERRRGGHVRALLSHALSEMRDAGQPLSALYTPHYSLYRKFGWELASRMVGYSLPPKRTKARRPSSRGSIRRASADDWQLLDDVYARHWAIRNGAFARTEGWWRERVFSDSGRNIRDAAIWSNHEGQVTGYAVYRTVHRDTGVNPWGETTLRVHDWVALDGEAYAGIITYLLGHDLVDHIVLLASADEPLPDALEEPVHLKEPPGAWFGYMLRLVDVKGALEARPALAQASGKSVTIGLTDETAPWNSGVWRIGSSEGRMACDRVDEQPQLETDVGALAPIFNGYVKPVDAARVGAVRVYDASAPGTLGDILAVSFSPYCPDDF